MIRQLRPDDRDAPLDAIRTSIPDDAPDWTENICWMMHDPKTGIGIYAHLGRMQPDRRIWEGLSLIFLPDGHLVNRSLGTCANDAGNAEYSYRPLIPAALWRFDFDGVAQRVDPEALRRRPVGDEPFEIAAYHLTFEAIQPVFNMHGATLGSERMHLEQGGRIHGTLRIGDDIHVIDCFGYRDHSVSRRTFLTLDSETWANCVFPSGRIASFLQVSRKERQILEGQIFVDGVMQTARPLDVAALKDAQGAPHEGVFRLEAAGRIHEIGWRTSPRNAIPFQLLRPVGLRPGIDRRIDDSLVAVQCPCEFFWDGEIGHGWMERLRPLNALCP